MKVKPANPDVLFDALRDHPDWSEEEREATFHRLVESFDPDVLIRSAEQRLDALNGADAEAVLRIVEAHGDDASFEALAQAVQSQDLPSHRLYEALAVLDGTDAFDRHEILAEWWEDLNATLEAPSLFEELLSHIEESDEGVLLALEGLGAVEPEIRAEIIEELGRTEGGPGLVHFLRLLVFSLDPATRSAALDALESRPGDDPDAEVAWRSIAADHDDANVVARALSHLDARAEPRAGLPAKLDRCRLARASVSTVDGEGRGVIVLFAHDENTGDWSGAAYLCDAMDGVAEVAGHVGFDLDGLLDFFEPYLENERPDAGPDGVACALGLLAGAVAATGPKVTPALRYWVEKTAGASFRARPGGLAGLFGDWDPAEVPFSEMRERSIAVLDAASDWLDRSKATLEIAREVKLRAEGSGPDPKRDAGAYRFLFEHRLLDRLERHRRMLYWMAALWRAEGEEYLGRSAQALAWQLADPQHAVPSHPFLVELTTRSLAAAMISAPLSSPGERGT